MAAPTPHARGNCGRSRASRPGGSRTTACFARSTPASRSGRGRSGRWRCSDANRPRSIRRGANCRTTCCIHQYLQWIAASQWQRARQDAHGVALFGDLPFMVDGDSADVWARQHQFRLDMAVGAPPDAFSATGQDWGMPLYNWEVAGGRGFPLAPRARAPQRRSVRRLPHRPPRRLLSHLRPIADRPARRASRRRTSRRSSRSANICSRCFASAGAEIIAEDLGTVPDFVRESLARSGVPGFRVLRWERRWHTEGQPFRDPSQYPRVSVASSRHPRHRAADRSGGSTRPPTIARR